MKQRCIVIPALKKNAVIPDQLVKKLAGVTLMERAIHTARAVEVRARVQAIIEKHLYIITTAGDSAPRP